MIQIKKTILTLALLLTAATGARADWTGGTYTATATENLGAITVNGDATLTINSDVTVTVTGGINVASGTLTVTGPGTLVVNGAKGNDGASAWKGSNGGNGGVAFAGTLTYKSGTVTANGGSAGSGGYIDDEERYASSGSAGKAFANDVDFTQTTGYSVTNGTSTIGSVLNQTKVVISGGIDPSASSGPEVAWDKDKKTGKFTMPGGNVTLEPEYYPQAALTAAPTAINDVPATTDGAIVSAGTVKNIGETTTAQGTVMYYVSPTALDDAALLALAADQWTADVPTAAGLAQGQAHVYYYVRGNDSDNDDEIFSDGDILATNALTVTLGAAPLWNAEFDLTDAPEEDKAGKWSTDIPEGGVVKGTEVKVTYSGTKKVIGVKAEKKAAPAAAEGHALSASAVGEIVGSDGNVYAVADKDNLPEGVTAVAMVAYKSATAGSSLAIALADEGSMNWNSAKSTCASKAAIGGKSWKLPTKDEWEQMFSANGGSTGLKTALSAAGGASSTLQNGYYWSSTEVVLDPEDDPDMAWIYSFGEVRWYWDDMVNGRQVRAVLAF